MLSEKISGGEPVEITEGFMDDLEMVVLDTIEGLRGGAMCGDFLSPIELAAHLCDPEYGEGKQLSSVDHTVALAAMAAIAMCWLAHREEMVSE